MALQLGVLREALIEGGASAEKAAAASEEVAGYENRLTKLTTMIQALMAIGLLLLASQGALWLEVGKQTAQAAEQTAQMARLTAKIDQVDATLQKIAAVRQ